LFLSLRDTVTYLPGLLPYYGTFKKSVKADSNTIC